MLYYTDNKWYHFINLFYQKISGTVFKICFSKCCSPSRATEQTFWKFYSPADTLWSAKSFGQVLDYTSEQFYRISIHRSVLVKLLASLLIKKLYLASRKVRLASRGAVVQWLSLLHRFNQRNLNSSSAQVQTLFVACRRFAMVRISDNGPGWK